MALTIQFLLTIPDKYSPSYIIDTNLSITKCCDGRHVLVRAECNSDRAAERGFIEESLFD